MKLWTTFFICALGLFHANAQVRSSADYTFTTETLDSGGGRSASADYTMDASIGLIVGEATAGAPVATVKAGYVAQLFDVIGLQISAFPLNVNEGATTQLAAQLIYDDATTFALPASAVAWSVQAGPIFGIATNGIATAQIVYRNELATVRGAYGGLIGNLGLTVLNVGRDNFGSYAGDQLDDEWQAQFFGLNNPLAGPTQDQDGDGQNNLFEYTAGTVPTDPLSNFMLRIEAVTGQPTQKNLIFSPRFADRTYVVTTTPELSLSSIWLPLTPSTTSDAGAERTVTDLDATVPKKFYRVEITKP